MLSSNSNGVRAPTELQSWIYMNNSIVGTGDTSHICLGVFTSWNNTVYVSVWVCTNMFSKWTPVPHQLIAAKYWVLKTWGMTHHTWNSCHQVHIEQPQPPKGCKERRNIYPWALSTSSDWSGSLSLSQGHRGDTSLASLADRAAHKPDGSDRSRPHL